MNRANVIIGVTDCIDDHVGWNGVVGVKHSRVNGGYICAGQIYQLIT